MALIQCPSCGGNISDKAEICPHCNTSVLICPECNSILVHTNDTCPSCGFPLSNSNPGLTKPKKKFNPIPLLIILSVVIVLFVVVSIYRKNTTYGFTLSSATYTMLNGGTIAEEAGDYIVDVWFAAIHDEPTTKTATYLVGAEDFNDALNNLFTSSMFKDKISAIIDNQYDASDLMKSLLDPPIKYREAYSSLKDLYTDYLTLTNLVMSLEGSYNTYSSSLSQAITDFLNSYAAMGIYLDH